jgi:hypothetical protein
MRGGLVDAANVIVGVANPRLGQGSEFDGNGP